MQHQAQMQAIANETKADAAVIQMEDKQASARETSGELQTAGPDTAPPRLCDRERQGSACADLPQLTDGVSWGRRLCE